MSSLYVSAISQTIENHTNGEKQNTWSFLIYRLMSYTIYATKHDLRRWTKKSRTKIALLPTNLAKHNGKKYLQFPCHLPTNLSNPTKSLTKYFNYLWAFSTASFFFALCYSIRDERMWKSFDMRLWRKSREWKSGFKDKERKMNSESNKMSDSVEGERKGE